jgi:hypothetical protein
LSTAGNNYDADYFGDTSKFSKAMRQQHGIPNDENWDETIFNVFRKNDGKISHFWGSEMSFAPPAPKQHHRAGDLVDPLWGLKVSDHEICRRTPSQASTWIAAKSRAHVQAEPTDWTLWILSDTSKEKHLRTCNTHNQSA